MMSLFARNSELRIRQNILRGVYEQNLVILGKGRPILSKRPLLRTKLLLSALMCVLAVLLHSQYVGTAVESPAPSIRATGAGVPTPLAAENSGPEPGLSALNVVADDRDVPLSRMFGLKIGTIMIDAGHGGSDSGSIGQKGTLEKNITLDIAKRLRNHLLKSGSYHVLMTREDDIAVPLTRRVEMARAAKADLFISIHLNYLPQKPINIIETYYFGPSNDEKAIRLAKQENAGSEYELSDFKEIVEKLGKTMKLQESREFAESIQTNLYLNSRKQNSSVRDFGVKRAPFVVLLGVEVPSVLAEVSCLSNQEEEMELNTEQHRENIARYLAAGIYDYLNKGDLTHEAKK